MSSEEVCDIIVRCVLPVRFFNPMFRSWIELLNVLFHINHDFQLGATWHVSKVGKFPEKSLYNG